MFYLMGIDAGTTTIRAVLFDEKGNEILSEARENKVYMPRFNYMEQDMDELWETVCVCVKAVLAKSGVNPKQIKGVGVAGQGEGLWLIDENGNPLRRAILWNDGRAAPMVNAIKEDQKLFMDIKNAVGSFPKAGATIILIKWLLENEPEVLSRARYALTCKDYIRYKLTGEVALEISDASTSSIDIRTKEYPARLFERLEIKGIERLFPTLISACSRAGEITPSVAQKTGLLAKTPVSGGMLDIVSTSAGAGSVEPGDVCIILGTSCINEITMSEFVFDEQVNGWERHMNDSLFVKVVGAMAGTPNLDWALVNVMGQNGFDRKYVNAMEEELSKIPVGAGGLIYHPYISPAGERAPFLNPSAAGGFFGLKLSTTKLDMMRAVYEGVALSTKDCLSHIKDIKRVYFTGGGARSRFWAQMYADSLGRELFTCKNTELSANGAAMSAGVMSGLYKNISEAVSVFAQIKDTYYPNREKTKQYEQLYAMYYQMRKASEPFWDLRAKFLNGE